MKKTDPPTEVKKAAASLISSYGDGFYFLGYHNDYKVFSYGPEEEPEIGAIYFLYKPKSKVKILYNWDALKLKITD